MSPGRDRNEIYTGQTRREPKMAALRALLLVTILLLSFAIGAPLQWLVARFAPGSAASRWIPLAFCRSLLFALNVRLEISGTRETRRPVLIAANHISWIDILALGAITPFCFLAKSEVATWPILSAFAEVQGTVFVDRKRRRSIPLANRDMAQRLDEGRPVLLFPEATTIDSPPLGRFYSSHFAAVRDLLAIHPEAEPVIQPVAIAYSSRAAAWVGDDNLLSHLWSTLCDAPLTCRIACGDPIPCGRDTNRKVLANETREAIVVLNEAHASHAQGAGSMVSDEIIQPAVTGR